MKNLFQPTRASLALVISLIATTWTLSSVGYYQLADFLGKPGGYNEGPRIFSIYYGVWCLIVFAIFHPALSVWAKRSSPPRRSRRADFYDDRLRPFCIYRSAISS